MSAYSYSNTSSEDIEYINIDYSDTSFEEFNSDKFFNKLFLCINYSNNINNEEYNDKSVLYNSLHQLQSNLNKLRIEHELNNIELN